MQEHIELTPREVVSELDRYIVGQADAKKMVAIALRNRWRRLRVQPPLQDEITPKNILMIGPTGVGKTEIARRLSKLAKAPFLKIEASKFTEVGYVGRDVESIVRDLTDYAVNMVREEEAKKVEAQAAQAARERVLDLMFPINFADLEPEDAEQKQKSREKMRTMLEKGSFDDRMVTISVEESSMPMLSIFSNAGLEEMGLPIKDMMGGMLPKKQKDRTVTVQEAIQVFEEEEREKLIDLDSVIKLAIERAEQSGIVFIDELDKVAGRQGGGQGGPDVSREGVQRDLLPIIEGTTVTTKYGLVHSDHILFIAAGAFHVAKPSDLIPELQGRFPIRVTLTSLGKDDFIRILTEPENSLIRQYTALMETEGVTIEFDKSAVARIAEISVQLNDEHENIGARRLQTVMEKVLEEESFKASDLAGQKIIVDKKFVDDRLTGILEKEDLSRYVL